MRCFQHRNLRCVLWRLRLLCILLFVPVACSDKGESAQPKVRSDNTDNSTVPHTASKPIPVSSELHRWDSDSQYRYSIAMSSVLEDQSRQPMAELTVSGTMVVWAMPREAANQAVVIQLDSLDVVIAGSTEKFANAFALELAQPVFGHYADGQLKKMVLPSNGTPLARGIWRTVLSLLQISDSPTGGPEFTTEEYDNNGQYRVHYEKTDEPNQWTRRKVAYEKGLFGTRRSMGVDLESPIPELLNSSGALTFEDGVVIKIADETAVRTALLGAQFMMNTTVFEATLKETGQRTGDVPRAPVDSLTVAAEEPFEQKLPLGAMDAQRIGNMTFDEVLSGLVAKARDPRRKKLWAKKGSADPSKKRDAEEWTKDWSVYFSALPAFFRQQPKTIAQAEKEIRKGSPATRSLLGGLASSGVPKAQKTLLGLINDTSLETSLRESAAQNLLQCRAPTVETAQSVQQLHNDELFSLFAVYGAGTFSRKLKEQGNPKQAQQLLDWLFVQLDRETTPDGRRDVLRGIANAAADDVFDKLQPWLTSKEPQERAGALEAIRHIDRPEVDSQIIAALNSSLETSHLVRKAAVNAASGRDIHGPVREAVVYAATKDPDKDVQKLARRLLASWAKKEPSLKN